MSNNVKVVKGALKEYLWGKPNGLAQWTDSTNKNQAELWFGDHESNPSIDIKTNSVLKTKSSYPLLIKLLCANEPLSIQVHPDFDTAEEKFSEFKLSDTNGKDEMIFALEEFHAYAGIRDKSSLKNILNNLTFKNEAAILKDLDPDNEFSRNAKIIFSLNEQDLVKVIEKLKQNLNNLNLLSQEIKALNKIIEKYPKDPGVLLCLLMNFYVLQKGEAIHVRPGTPHSYVYGLGVEVMTNSDNVLRMGLTNKELNIEAALSIVKDYEIQVLKLPTSDGIHIYKPETSFELLVIDNAVKAEIESDFSCILNIEGETNIKIGSEEILIKPGQAALSTQNISQIQVKGHAVVARTV